MRIGFFTWFFSITLLSIICFTTIIPVQSQCLEDQKSLLLQLKNTLKFNSSNSIFSVKLVNWTQINDCCDWLGVECDQAGHVIGLDLSYESIFGGFNDSSSLFGLHFLEKLYLGGNNLTQIPSNFGNLEKLRGIYISECNFGGQIPNSFEKLIHLETLKLSYNNFTGKIPSFLFSLPSLIDIDLSDNRFGEISGFPPNGSLSPLIFLDLSNNKIEGPIPSYFFDFQSLQTLLLSSNNFNGTIQLESIFQRLTYLIRLDLSHNNLSVDVNVDISNMSSFSQLSWLALASCNLQKFPALLMNQSILSGLDLSDNQISGIIPNWIWIVANERLMILNLSCNFLVGLQSDYIMPINLYTLDLHSNQLGGEIPIPPLYASYVDYSRNNFSSSIPAGIGNRLYFLSLANNMLTGAIHPSICNASSLEFLDLSNNRFSGTIPQCLIDTRTTTLRILNLQNNNLAGNIMGTFPEGCNLRTLDLNDNHLEGQVPKSLVKCVDTEVLNLGTNNITDDFPCFLANLSSLRVLVLRSNQFKGNISCHGIQRNIWPKLQIIDLALNNFSGILPTKFFLQFKAMMVLSNSQAYLLSYNSSTYVGIYYQDSVTIINKGQEMKLVKILTIFTAIDISNNSFKGDIPDTIGDLKSLYVLNLSHNALTSSIPSSLGNLTQLGSLDLSFNNLNGGIPETLESLTFLSSLNLSHNQLVGRIPQRYQFGTFSNTSFDGNVGLCGPPLNTSCRDAEPPTSHSTPTFERRDSYFDEDEIKLIYITAAVGFTMGFGVIVVPLLYWERWRQCYYKHVERILLRIINHQDARATHQRRR